MATKQPPRQKIPSKVETQVYAQSRRRCALCFHLNDETQEKEGQIAHLDKNRSNNAPDNLAYLCLVHHSKYDSKTSQHKNYTIEEVKHYRHELYRWVKRGMPSRSEAPTALTTPRVVLSRSGTDLQVESFGMEALNVRLVQADSENYRLRSEVIRCLKPDAPQPFILRCERRQDENTPVLQTFAVPAHFFNDVCDSFLPDNSTLPEFGEQVLTMLTERGLAVTVELAYSDSSGSNHYRRPFKVRWDRLDESITDIEPMGISKDDNPPPTVPFNVILPS